MISSVACRQLGCGPPCHNSSYQTEYPFTLKSDPEEVVDQGGPLLPASCWESSEHGVSDRGCETTAKPYGCRVGSWDFEACLYCGDLGGSRQQLLGHTQTCRAKHCQECTKMYSQSSELHHVVCNWLTSGLLPMVKFEASRDDSSLGSKCFLNTATILSKLWC